MILKKIIQMTAPRKETKIILSGHHKNLSNLVFTFIILLTFSSNSEEIKIAPLINLDEIEPSYDEEFILNNIESQLTESGQKNVNKNDNSALIAEISILNKITTNVDTVKLSLKENYLYQELKIYPIDCHLSEPYEKSEVGIYLNIHYKDSKEKIFSGWMLKSLPSISSMEHPIYDIWVEDCS
ncbi:MAG: DUF2155 domain-containing protein [Candidatus Pelagibacterales bacterium]